MGMMNWMVDQIKTGRMNTIMAFTDLHQQPEQNYRKGGGAHVQSIESI